MVEEGDETEGKERRTKARLFMHLIVLHHMSVGMREERREEGGEERVHTSCVFITLACCVLRRRTSEGFITVSPPLSSLFMYYLLW